jgi:hypothetical protein
VQHLSWDIRGQGRSSLSTQMQVTGALSRRPCPEECTHCQKVQQRQAAWECESLLLPRQTVGTVPPSLEEQLNVVGLILQEVKYGQRPEWKDIRCPQSHFQNLLGRVEIPSCWRWRARAPLGVGGRKNENSTSSCSPDQGEGSTANSTEDPLESTRHLTAVLLAELKERRQEIVPTV